MAHHSLDPEVRACIDECTSCHEICTECITHCLTLGGRHADAAHIRTMIDCAEICQTSANFMLRGSDLHSQVCGLCAEACERCARSCDAIANGDDMMLRCAEECRRCAQSCREMAGAGPRAAAQPARYD